MSEYLLQTKSTRRARNRIDAIQKRLLELERQNATGFASDTVEGRARPLRRGGSSDAISADREGGAEVVGARSEEPAAVGAGKGHIWASEDDREGLERDLRVLRRSVNDREMEAADRSRNPKKRGPGRAPKGSRPRDVANRRGGGQVEAGMGGFAHLDDRGLWGEPRAGSGRLVPLPSFEDPVLDRAADIFRAPGLAHFMSVQMQRQDTFADFEALVSAWAPQFGSLALSDAYGDCEIDLEIAAELQRGETARAARLVDDAAGGGS